MGKAIFEFLMQWYAPAAPILMGLVVGAALWMRHHG